jgi:hypothetical protein
VADGEIYITGRVKDIIIHAGHNLYPHEIEDVVAGVRGVRKGCVVAFGATDPIAGTERLVIVAESRERNRDARARLAQDISAKITEALGTPPNVVEVVPPNAIPKTSSGKLRRDATRQRFLSGKLVAEAPPVWRQLARLAAASSAGRIRAGLRRTAGIAYGCYAIAVFVVLLFPAWVYVRLSPSRKSSARVTIAALRSYLKLAGWRVRVEGREHLAASATRMLVANHTSYADISRFAAKIPGRDWNRLNESKTLCATANPFLFFRKGLSRHSPACGPFTLAHSKQPSPRSGKSFRSRSMARGAFCATVPGCRARDASR